MTDKTTRLQARVKVLEDALRIAQVHVANNAQGWSVGRGASRDDLAFVDAALAASLPADPVTNAGCRQPVRVKPSPDEHYDDYCIRQFAKLMSEKMAASRAKGRSGWNDPERCSIEYLRSLLYEHLDKGDPVDVANFCMMLRHYEASTYREFCNCTPQPSPDVAAKVQALVDDGRPCASDLFLVALFDQINDVHDREYFIKAWLEGDWECATSEITIGAAK